MTWTDTISCDAATGHLSRLYDRIKGPADNVDNICSLIVSDLTRWKVIWPCTNRYCITRDNEVSRWFLETIGLYTRLLNRCEYCIEHHYQGLRRILDDEARCAQIRQSLVADSWTSVFEKAVCAALGYARKLTLQPAEISQYDVGDLRTSGWSDGDILGLSPDGEGGSEDWTHR